MADRLRLKKDSAKALKEAMNGDVDLIEFGRVVGVKINQNSKPVDAILDIANVLLGGSGVEAIQGEWVDRYFQDIQLLYVNMGGTYDTTLLFDTVNGKFIAGSWGDFVESHPKRFPS